MGLRCFSRLDVGCGKRKAAKQEHTEQTGSQEERPANHHHKVSEGAKDSMKERKKLALDLPQGYTTVLGLGRAADETLTFRCADAFQMK